METTRRQREYAIIESKRWLNTITGRTASIYGALPYFGDVEAKNWIVETVGWTVRSNAQGTVGIGRIPWKTREEVEQWLAQKD